MPKREWRVVTIDAAGEVVSNYGQGLDEEVARRVHRFAQSCDGEAATLQFREPPAAPPPWETASAPKPISADTITRAVARTQYRRRAVGGI